MRPRGSSLTTRRSLLAIVIVVAPLLVAVGCNSGKPQAQTPAGAASSAPDTAKTGEGPTSSDASVPDDSIVGLSPQRAAIIMTLASGTNIEELQLRVEAMENKAIANESFSAADKEFLRDLYSAMAFGAKKLGTFAQSGRMMDRYLECSGTPLELEPSIFSKNARVRAQVRVLAEKMSAKNAAPSRVYRSPRFYMPDPSTPDSVMGLYWGTVEGSIRVNADGSHVFHYRAEVPWEWPSYESLRKKYGTPHAETFPLPNLRSVIGGPRYALHIENGLGEYLVRLGLAKPFVAWGEWDEPAPDSR
jgi:hypothetical protein